MTKFKSGDKVERKEVVCDSTTQLTGIKQWGIYTVDTVCGDDISLAESFKPDFTFPSERFELVEEQDDPLPPAPESVRYYTSTRKMNYLDIQVNPYGELCIAATSDRDTFYNYLDADAALQLAHDLTRMAMEIKRKEKQNA